MLQNHTNSVVLKNPRSNHCPTPSQNRITTERVIASFRGRAPKPYLTPHTFETPDDNMNESVPP
jgi:hypothetical protein